jgi:hypothetical protein
MRVVDRTSFFKDTSAYKRCTSLFKEMAQFFTREYYLLFFLAGLCLTLFHHILKHPETIAEVVGLTLYFIGGVEFGTKLIETMFLWARGGDIRWGRLPRLRTGLSVLLALAWSVHREWPGEPRKIELWVSFCVSMGIFHVVRKAARVID